MLANEPTWTVERIELLKNRFEAGLTCREIACDIGVSRNAVIGKLSRLNLTRDKRGDAPPRSERVPRRHKAARERYQGSNISCCGRCTPSLNLRLSTSRSTTGTPARCSS